MVVGREMQTIVFGCIAFHSAQCTYDASASDGGSYDVALAEFVTCATVSEDGTASTLFGHNISYIVGLGCGRARAFR
jgi:hypothetical protein